MPAIPITDQFGIALDAQPANTSALLTYLKQIPSLKLESLDLTKIAGLTLDQPAVRNISTGISFGQPIDVGKDAPKLSIAAGVSGSLKFGDDASCSLSIEATASAKLSEASGVLSFGAAPSTKIEITSTSHFPRNSGVTLAQAVRDTVDQFTIPAAASDLKGMAAGQRCEVSVNGKLRFSGSANLLAVTNPLAAVTLPSPLPGVSVKAAGNVSVGVSCTLETEFAVSATKMDTGFVRLGWRRKKASQVTVSASASEGIDAQIGSTELFTKIIGAISKDPEADLKELTSAGLSADQSAEIQQAVKAAVERKLEISVQAAFTASDTQTTAFDYDLDPAQWDDASQHAIDAALAGDLSFLHAGALSGVTCVRSIWDDVRKRSLELDVNLLGIFNFRSVSSLALEGKVLVEPVSGALTITDTATADRIRSTQVNFGADTQKLRSVLAESFLLTAAYHGSNHELSAPTLRCSHSYFDLQNSTSVSEMWAKLHTGIGLGLLTLADVMLPKDVADFGRTLFLASADYDDRLVRSMFLDSTGTALPVELYERMGRMALQFVVMPGDDDEARLKPASDDILWKRMKEAGPTMIPSLFVFFAEPIQRAIVSDYLTIRWWADAMSKTAQLLESRSTTHEQLAAHLLDVAKTTREEFGQPWGLIAMNLLVQPQGGARMVLTGPILALEKQRDLAAVATK